MDAIAVEVIRGDGGRTVSVAVTDGPTRFSDASPSGEIHYSGRGRGTQNEAGAEALAKLLMRRLYPNVLHARVEKMPKDHAADWKILAGSATALVQVTRAPATSDLRRRFAQQSMHHASFAPDEAHEAILGPIRKKAGHYEPAALRAQLVLALDIADLPGLAAPSVVESLRSLRGAELAAAGFRRIYLVEAHLDTVVCVFDGTS